MARGQIEENLRAKMASIKVSLTLFSFPVILQCFQGNIDLLKCCWLPIVLLKDRLYQLQDAQKGADVTSEATERELELEAQLVEARSIIQEQVSQF